MARGDKETFRRYMEMWTQGDVERLHEVIAPGYVGHSGADPSRDDDIDRLREHIAAYHRANPDVEVEVEDQLAEGDRVATRMTARSKDPTTGQVRVSAGFNISRFVDGLIVEEWALWERP